MVRHLLTFMLVVGVLLAGKWVLAEWQAFRSVSTDLATLERGNQEIDAYRTGLVNELTTRMAGLQADSVAGLDARIGAISQRIQARSIAQAVPILSFPLPKASQLAQGVVAHSRRAVEIELLIQERDYLVQLRAAVDAGLNRQAAHARMELLRLEYAKISAALQENRRLQDQLQQQSPVKMQVPGMFEHRKSQTLVQRHDKLRSEAALAHQAFLDQKAIADRLAAIARPAPFQVSQARLDVALAPLRGSIAQGQALSSQNWIAKASGQVMDVVPTAALLMLSMLVAPLGIKLLFYFVLAPLAARLRPIYLVRDAPGTAGTSGGLVQTGTDPARISAVSQSVSLGPEDELLIHSEYIQSLFISGRKNTKWLLDWSCPFTSMAAGLVAMTRIRPNQTGTAVISATTDPLSEIALIVLPDGAAMVFQPRALAGVMYRKDRPLTIHRHWRLGSLHAWLTLQLRYLVFRGPVTLIVKGCRGVRIEAADNGRSISQSATLGFSANLAYSTIRSETFFPYLTGKQALFHDRFAGRPGVYVYEETPRAGKKPGIVGRGLTGLTDSVLKVFGI